MNSQSSQSDYYETPWDSSLRNSGRDHVATVYQNNAATSLFISEMTLRRVTTCGRKA
jgi:hypothetical protein